MRIRDLAYREGRAGKWESFRTWGSPAFLDEEPIVEENSAGPMVFRIFRTIRHYSTVLIHIPIYLSGTPIYNNVNDFDLPVIESLGHGSVSDQNGLNQIFKELMVPWRYARDQRSGGPRIEHLNQTRYWQEGKWHPRPPKRGTPERRVYDAFLKG